MTNSRIKLIFLTKMAIIMLFFTANLHCQDKSTKDLVRTELDLIRKLDNSEPVFFYTDTLLQAGKDAVPFLQEALKSAKNPNQTIAASYVLLKAGSQKEACDALKALITSTRTTENKKVEAISALGSEGGEYASALLREMLSSKLDDFIKVELAKSLWRLTRGSTAEDKLKKLLDSKSIRARNKSALALSTFLPLNESVSLLKDLVFKPGRDGEEARNVLKYRARAAMVEGDFTKVAPILRQITEHPSLSLGTERLLLDINNWSEINKAATKDLLAARLIQEIVDIINENYAVDQSGDQDARKREKERVSSLKLATNAAKALAQSIDPFSDYLDEADIKEMSEQIDGEYGGIGAWVGMRNGRFTILLPMYSEPAFNAGLRAMDWVEKIDGKEIKNNTQKEIIKMLKGKPGTKVKLSVWRRKWNKSHEFTVKRKKINIPSVKSKMLPDDIGYIRIERFGREDSTPVELNSALRRLRKQGMKALILDLSNNPGGMLSTAVKVSDKFLSGGKLIVYSEGKPGVHNRKEYYSHTFGTEPDYPMVVLVNSSSASASEIVSGALRDHKRATLVGKKTFGKGSVQQLIWVNSTGKRTCLKLTIAKYYLPNGDCIHNKGIEPDVEVKTPELSMASFEARKKLIDSLIISDYIRKTYDKHESKFTKLMKFDHEDAARYPEFADLKKRIEEEKIDISNEDIRHEIRRALVTYLETEKGVQVVVDMQENPPLQQAIIEIRKKLENKSSDIPLYTWYEKKIAARMKEEQEKKDKMYPPPPDEKAENGKK
ncbi:MAG: S41 family peptidase [Planctomycetota bacterium]|jgi:carboxyl-terminal processing protease